MDAVDVPNDDNDEAVYLVADDFGRLGHAWREADYEATDLETVIHDLLTGQYSHPIRVVAFNTAERWSDDVSEDVARELRRRCDLRVRDIHFTCRISRIGTKAVITMCNCRCLCQAFKRRELTSITFGRSRTRIRRGFCP